MIEPAELPVRPSIADVIDEFDRVFADRPDIVWSGETIVWDHLPEVIEADLLAHFDMDDVVTLRLSKRDAIDLRQKVRTWMETA